MSELLERTLHLHLDPASGTPYWLEREQALGFSICQRIQSVDDLPELGVFDLQALQQRPLEDFIPRSILGDNRIITAQSGGTTGAPKQTAYLEDEFQAAFVDSFLGASAWRTSTCSGHWLWLGPGGPHIIGKAAQQIAVATTGCDAFSIDFDPRWYRTLAPDSIARERYLQHLLGQAEQILLQQNIHYLFTTPVILLALLKIMPEKCRQAISFIYLGGMPVSKATLYELGEAFPGAAFLAGYGNTLFGVCHESRPHRPGNELPVYFPPAERLLIQLVSMDETKSDSERLRTRVACGERGQVVMHRLDRSCFLANVMERDSGIRTPAGSNKFEGLMDPQAIQNRHFPVENGIY